MTALASFAGPVGASPVALTLRDASINRPTNVTTPTVVVATGFPQRALPLGLAQPLELRGGPMLEPEGLLSSLPFDWLPALLGFVAESCAGLVDRGDAWLTMPPAALAGAAGSGRTHLARQIARHAGLPFATLDVGEPDAFERLRPTPSHPDVAIPPTPLLAMARSGCANPVILVTGVAQASDATIEALSAMVDPEVSGEFVDEALEAILDFSHVNWLIATPPGTPAAARLPQTMHVVDVGRLRSDPENEALAFSLVMEAMADLRISSDDLGGSAAQLLGQLAYLARRLEPHQRTVGPVTQLYAAAFNGLLELAGVRP